MEALKIYIGKGTLTANEDKNLYLTFKLNLLQPLDKHQLLGAWVGIKDHPCGMGADSE